MHTASVKTALGVKLFLRALRAWCIISELSVWTRPCPATPRRLPQETGFDQRIDHRQENFESRGIRAIIMTIKYPGVAQLVGRHIWDVEAARSSRATRTKNRQVSIRSLSICFIYPMLYGISYLKISVGPENKEYKTVQTTFILKRGSDFYD